MLAWTAGLRGPESRTTDRASQKSVATTANGIGSSSKVSHERSSHREAMIDSALMRPLRRKSESIIPHHLLIFFSENTPRMVSLLVIANRAILSLISVADRPEA